MSFRCIKAYMLAFSSRFSRKCIEGISFIFFVCFIFNWSTEVRQREITSISNVIRTRTVIEPQFTSNYLSVPHMRFWGWHPWCCISNIKASISNLRFSHPLWIQGEELLTPMSATQSSTYEDTWGNSFLAANCIDGVTGAGKMCHTRRHFFLGLLLTTARQLPSTELISSTAATAVGNVPEMLWCASPKNFPPRQTRSSLEAPCSAPSLDLELTGNILPSQVKFHLLVK